MMRSGLFMLVGFLLLQCDGKRESFIFRTEDSSSITSVFASEDRLEPLEYVKWIETPEHGLTSSKTIGKYTYTLQYKPLNYVVLQELSAKNISEKELKRKRAEIEDYQYFTFKIEADAGVDILKAEITSGQDYYLRVEYFSFMMQKDLKLVDGQDTLPCVMHHYERTYGITPYSSFVLGFDLSKKEKDSKNKEYKSRDKVLIYEDNISGNGTVKLKLFSKYLCNVPELKTFNDPKNEKN